MKIIDIITTFKGRDLPKVKESDSVDKVMAIMHRHAHSRLVYVVNEENHLTGTITLGMLVRHVAPHKYEPKIHPGRMLGLVTHETAKDIMLKKPVSAVEEEEVEKVLKRMIDANVKEIGILNNKGELISDITMLDILIGMTNPGQPD